MTEIRRDLRYASRQLLQHPGFTVAAVLTLALAIGLNSAVFSAVNALLFRPLPVAEPAELVAIFSSEPGDFMARSPLSALDFEQLAAGGRALANVVAYTYAPLAVEHGGDSRLVLGVRASRDFFAVLGVEAALGRTFAAAAASGDDEAGEAAPDAAAPDEVVLSHSAWRRRFGADPEAIGSVLRVGGRPAIVVGSLTNAHAVDPGFDPRGVAVVTFAPRAPSSERQTFDRRLLERVRALPGVHSAALASHLPLTVEIRFDRVAVEGSEPAEESWPSIDSALVGPGYFEALRVPFLRGRGFEQRDDAGAPPVAVVNRSFAERFAPGGEILGRRLRIAGEEAPPGAAPTAGGHRVVGIVGDGKYRTLGESGRPFLYRALAQHRGRARGQSGEITTGSETLVARTRGEPAAVLPELRRTLRELDPRVAVARLETLEETLAWALFLPGSAAALFGLFGVLGLALAAVGLAGVLGYAVRRRTREIGIRMALGAGRRQILALVLRQGLALTLAGVVLGLTAALATTRALSAALYGVAATDPPTFAGVAVFLILVALLAIWLPARRAAGVDPATSLRSQ